MSSASENIRDIIARAKALHASHRHVSAESVALVGELEARRVPAMLGMSAEAFAPLLGLTPNQYWKRAQAARLIRWFPEAGELIRAGKVQLAHLVLIAPKLTRANAGLVFQQIAGKSKRDVEAFMSRVTLDGRVLDRTPQVTGSKPVDGPP